MKKILYIILIALCFAAFSGAETQASMPPKKKVTNTKKNKRNSASASQVAKDVNEFCRIIQVAIDDGIYDTSSSAMRFAESPLSIRISKYERQGKLTKEQKDRIQNALDRWSENTMRLMDE